MIQELLALRAWIRRIKLQIMAGLCCGQQKTIATNGHWAEIWACGPQLTEPANLPPAPLATNTLRQPGHQVMANSIDLTLFTR
jgi:hypothetical protein